MRRASVRIPALLGLDRNRVSGVDELAPDHLVNFMDARGGGYTPAGAWAGSPDVSWSGFPGFVGSDAMGLASLRSGAVSGEYRYGLYRGGGSFVNGSFAGGPGAGSHYGAHVPGVGAYASIDRFLVQDRDGNVVEPQDFASGSDFVPPEVTAGSPPEVGVVGSFDVVSVGYDPLADRWVAVGGSPGVFQFAYRDGDGEWVSPAAVTVAAGQVVRDMARTSTTWIAVGSGGLVMRSEDGVTWTNDSFGAHNFVSVAADPNGPSVWVAPVVNAEGFPVYLRESSDHGETWTANSLDGELGGLYGTSTVGGVTVSYYRVALGLEFIHSEGNLAVLVGTTSHGSGSSFGVWDPGAGEWVQLYAGQPPGMGVFLPIAHSPMGGSAENGAYVRMAVDAGGRALLALNDIGWFSRPDDPSTPQYPVGFAFFIVETGAGSASPGGMSPQPSYSYRGQEGDQGSLDLMIGDAVFASGRWVVVGRGNRAFSYSDGDGWVEFQVGEGDYLAAAVGADGRVFATGVGGVSVAWSPSGQSAYGRYEVVMLVSLMTAAGKLVVWVGEQDFRVLSPEERAVSAHSFDDELAVDFAENVTTDVYVRFTPRVFDEESGRWVINEPTGGFTHAASLAGGESWSVDAPGVGSQVLGISGGVAVAAFRNSDSANVVAEHNGRVWFQAGGSYAWRVLMGVFDFPTLEDERTVAFSVGGFVNLVELDGWLRFAATQSESLNGILPSPQGLLILFDNEVFSLTGDVALNNLQALLFPDNVGLTAGCKAVLAGGVPISLWRGKLWALQSGVAQDVAAPVWRADDEFVDVVSDPLTRSAVALTVGGSLFALRTDTGFWFELPSVPAGGTERLLGSPSGFRAASEDGAFTRVRGFVGGVLSPAVPEVAWLNLDAGDALRRDNWLNFRFSFEGAGAGAASPVAYYRPTDAGSSVPSVFSKDSGFRVVGVRRGDEWWFQFPVGLRSRRLDVLIEFPGVTRDFVVEPGVDFTILPGHLEGRRPQL